MPWKNPEDRRRARREWYKKNKAKHIQSVIKYARTHPEITAKIQRKFNYGITQEEYETLLEKQSHSCAICFKSFIEVKPKVDHDHQTKVVRGILCGDCILGLGRFKDSPKILDNAIRYLVKEKV